MHFHIPKPLHGWRAFVGEVGIIVLGVLIALGAQQAIEAVQWRQKVEAAKKSIDFELNDQLDYSEEAVQISSCRAGFIDALEAAILRHDGATIGKLHDTRPFEPRPWRSTLWQSAMSTQVADHIEVGELAQYAFLFTSFDDIRRAQEQIIDDFAEATAGRLGGPTDTTSTQLQLSAAERLRTQLNIKTMIAKTAIDVSGGIRSLGWPPIHRHRWQRTGAAQLAKNCSPSTQP